MIHMLGGIVLISFKLPHSQSIIVAQWAANLSIKIHYDKELILL